eukprot:Partr_v1_DN29015_c0_g1_i2_m58765 putative Set and mynd domain containing
MPLYRYVFSVAQNFIDPFLNAKPVILCDTFEKMDEICAKLTDNSARISKHPSPGRGCDKVLVATRDFARGDVVFVERTRIHSLNSNGDPVEDIHEIMPDWQRVIYAWISDIDRDLYLEHLSTDGATSQLAIDRDPGRLPDFKRGAERLSKRISGIESAVIERMLHILETNCHSRPLEENEAHNRGDDEEMVGLWLLASVMEHSCLPNCTVIIHPTVDDDGAATLELRAISNVKAGELLTISYVDMEFEPTVARQEMLMDRGFVCRCPTCSGDDYCDVLLDNNGSITQSHLPVDDADVDEDEENERLILLLNCILTSFESKFTVDTLSGVEAMHSSILATAHTIPADDRALIVNFKTYQLLKRILFDDNGMYHFMFPHRPLVACLWLVVCNCVLMARVGMQCGEDLCHNLKWALESISINDDPALKQRLEAMYHEQKWTLHYRPCGDPLSSR